MLHRHDYITPYINGVRFFDKPPLMYWMAAGSMHLFGEKDWAARLPLALCVLALLLSTYALGIRLFANISPAKNPDRGGFYAALALATAIGPYLYTRFYIPDILLALWMTLAVHLFLIALDRLHSKDQALEKEPQNRVPHLRDSPIVAKVGNRDSDPLSLPNQEILDTPSFASSTKNEIPTPSPLIPCLAFAAVMALNVLTKGLIGLVFPIAFVLLYLAITKQLRLLFKLHLIPSILVFLLIAAPWHILAALRTPAITMPTGIGLPATSGWAWFYLYNEHIARFLSTRIPHDYGLTPIWLFWLYLAIWVMPWTTFLPPAVAHHIRGLKQYATNRTKSRVPHLRDSLTVAKVGHRASDPLSFHNPETPAPPNIQAPDNATLPPNYEAALALLLWAAIVLGFFSISNRQEYYSLPAIPALALIAAGLLARADRLATGESSVYYEIHQAQKSALNWHLYLLFPLTTVIVFFCAWFAVTAPHPAPNTDLSTLLAANPSFYNLSLGHLFDLTGDAMGLFRGPLIAVALSMLGIGIGSYLLRRSGRTYAANLTLAAAMTCTLLAAHEGLSRFYPILGSKQLAQVINHAQQADPHADDLILLDGELTSGSTLIFYTGQQVHLLDGRVNGLWYGSFWPDCPKIFETESSLRQLWQSSRRVFLFTYNPTARAEDLAPYAPVHTLASAGGKTILTNH
ncbi:glycosyltransferase family 39 protein [Granulicella sp. L60]|uniref:ArnT family glycosyltransferase n=1 Tax=Granulicella sp. L60 TaxID=1641866 RepID=UPI0020B168AF|nr:glycosyltransferase family 39 protein [Granulicella sp. L60]